jgi:hypothetical protein
MIYEIRTYGVTAGSLAEVRQAFLRLIRPHPFLPPSLSTTNPTYRLLLSYCKFWLFKNYCYANRSLKKSWRFGKFLKWHATFNFSGH